jgi:hypothetical protein
VKGNFHAWFLGGVGGLTARAYPVQHYTYMNITRFLPAMLFLLFVGCKSDHTISGLVIPDQSHPVASASSISTTNIYYMIDRGPSCTIFIKQSDVDPFFGPSSQGTKVVVIDGHFPSPTQMPLSPTISVSQSLPPLNYTRRDMSLIDDTGTK